MIRLNFKKKKSLFLTLVLMMFNLFDIKCQVTEELITEEAENGGFLSQVDLACYYMTGTSATMSITEGEIDNVKAVHYCLLAITNSENTGKANEIKSILMADMAQCYYDGDRQLKEDLDEAFFWAYAALSCGLTSEISWASHKKALIITALRLYEYARFEPRFASEALFMLKSCDFGGALPLMLNLAKTGCNPSTSLSFNVQRSKDGNFKYIGELKNGKPNGLGIHIGKNTIYCGDFVDGEYSGKGYLLFKDTENIMYGEWRKHKLWNGELYQSLSEPSVIYKAGKDIWPRPISLNIGKQDKRGFIIPEPVSLGLSVRRASKPMEEFYCWGATNPEHRFQSSNSSAPNYLSRSACLAIYGGAGRKSDISATGYDAPYCLWNNSWRMPTLAELQELITKCEVSIDGGKIYICNNDEVLLIDILSLYALEEVGIWSGSIDPTDNNKAYALIVDVETGHISIESRDRECSFAILPVTDVPFLEQFRERIKNSGMNYNM